MYNKAQKKKKGGNKMGQNKKLINEKNTRRKGK